jgi:hypothetical protein
VTVNTDTHDTSFSLLALSASLTRVVVHCWRFVNSCLIGKSLSSS